MSKSSMEGPVVVESAGLQRVKCRTIDGTEGWVTLTGNNGTSYLQVSEGVLQASGEVGLELES